MAVLPGRRHNEDEARLSVDMNMQKQRLLSQSSMAWYRKLPELGWLDLQGQNKNALVTTAGRLTVNTRLAERGDTFKYYSKGSNHEDTISSYVTDPWV